MKDLALSFVYAFRGIAYCLHHERNMRIHVTCLAYMFSYLTIYDFFEITSTQYAVLCIASAGVIASELLNTAIERTVDVATKQHCELARIAKDCAAGGVLVFTLFAVGAGIAIMWQPQAFAEMARYYSENPAMIVVLLASFAVSLFYIFVGPLGIAGWKKGKK